MSIRPLLLAAIAAMPLAVVSCARSGSSPDESGAGPDDATAETDQAESESVDGEPTGDAGGDLPDPCSLLDTGSIDSELGATTTVQPKTVDHICSWASDDGSTEVSVAYHGIQQPYDLVCDIEGANDEAGGATPVEGFGERAWLYTDDGAPSGPYGQLLVCGEGRVFSVNAQAPLTVDGLIAAVENLTTQVLDAL